MSITSSLESDSHYHLVAYELVETGYIIYMLDSRDVWRKMLFVPKHNDYISSLIRREDPVPSNLFDPQ